MKLHFPYPILLIIYSINMYINWFWSLQIQSKPVTIKSTLKKGTFGFLKMGLPSVLDKYVLERAAGKCTKQTMISKNYELLLNKQ